MKKLIKILTIFSLTLVMILVACGNSVTIDVKGKMEISIYKTSISVATTFQDSEDALLAAGRVKAYVVVVGTVDDEEKEINRKSVDVDTEKLTGTLLNFESLSVGETYTARLVASLDGHQQTLETKTFTTISNGESEDDPILVASLADLMAMSKDKEAYYKLDADIDCADQTMTSIFNSSNIFQGSLDGNGHSISNFSLESNNYSGLFGSMKNATVKNLTLNNVTYSQSRGDTQLGALAGRAENCTLTNITIKGVNFTHSGTPSKTAHIGGFVGVLKNCKVENITVTEFDLKITRAQLYVYAGGLVGKNEGSSIANCSVEGALDAIVVYPSYENGFVYIGGFIGSNDSSKDIKDSYAIMDLKVTESSNSTGYKTHSSYIGGFIGGNEHAIAKISGCVAIGKMDITLALSYAVHVGGFAGKLVYGSIIKNCAYVPTEEGFAIDLMDPDDEGVIAQTSYVSLTCAYTDTKVNLTNVFATAQKFEIKGEKNNATVSSAVISTDISSFIEVIQNKINGALNPAE